MLTPFYRQGPEIRSNDWLEGGKRRWILRWVNMTLSCFTAVYRRANLAHDAAYYTTYITPCQPILSHQPLHIYYAQYLLIDKWRLTWYTLFYVLENATINLQTNLLQSNCSGCTIIQVWHIGRQCTIIISCVQWIVIARYDMLTISNLMQLLLLFFSL